MKIIADIPNNILSIINDNNGLISSEQLAILQKSIMDGALYFDTPKCIIKVNTAVEAQTIANELKRQEAVGVIIPNEFEIERLNKPQGDLISREALKEVFNGYHSGIGSQPKFTLGACLQLIDNAPTSKPKLSDKQIEEITDLLENEWGYEGMREEVTRILRGEE